jgi:hypothetical protein
MQLGNTSQELLNEWESPCLLFLPICFCFGIHSSPSMLFKVLFHKLASSVLNQMNDTNKWYACLFPFSNRNLLLRIQNFSQQIYAKTVNANTLQHQGARIENILPFFSNSFFQLKLELQFR